jgi:hypothetical protein
MFTTTHPEFDASTEALLVAEAFSTSIVGKTVLVTGVSLGGIGFTTAQAFVRETEARGHSLESDVNVEAGLTITCSCSHQWSHPFETS